ncbi:MAG: hypothetical protein DDT22_00945 [candidate division WS2 bacterium]|nr:hypothetical protein [Bacillota bacterium]MBT9175271.1 hypothetical protein [Candidatus Lithacetigena glycinireducens]
MKKEMTKTRVEKIIKRVVKNYNYNIDLIPEVICEKWDEHNLGLDLDYDMDCVAKFCVEWYSKKWREATEKITPNDFWWSKNSSVADIKAYTEFKIADINEENDNNWLQEFCNYVFLDKNDPRFIDISACTGVAADRYHGEIYRQIMREIFTGKS